MKNAELGNYFDQYERQINDPWNPLNFLPVERPVEFGTVGVVNREEFDRIFRQPELDPIMEIEIPVAEEIILLAA